MAEFRPPKEEPKSLETADSSSQERIRILVKAILEAGKLKTSLETQISEAKDTEKRLKAQLLEEMDAIQMTSFRMKDVGLVYVHASPKISVLKADKPELMVWLKDHGHGDIVKEDVNTNTLKAFVKGLREEGQEVPPFVKEYLHREPRFRSS